MLKTLPEVELMLCGGGMDQHIIEVGGDKGEASANLVHQSLEGVGCPRKRPKGMRVNSKKSMPGPGQKAVFA